MTFGFSWLVWLPVVLANLGVISYPVQKFAEPLSIAGFFGPMFGASVLTYRAEGWRGLKRFLGRLFNFRFPLVWWVVIVALPLSIQATAHTLSLLANVAVPSSFVSSVPMFFSIYLMVTLLGGGQEEVGWRSYVLDRLQGRYSALVSSLILGSFWTCWHIPLYFMPGTSLSSTPFGPFLVVCLSLSIILAWIYNNTGRNMVAVILAHGMVNATHALFPVMLPSSSVQIGYMYWAAISAIVAGIIAVIWGPASLTRRQQIV